MIPVYAARKLPVFSTNKSTPTASIDFWPHLLHKGLASLYGSYDKLAHADPAHTLFDLTGNHEKNNFLKNN